MGSWDAEYGSRGDAERLDALDLDLLLGAANATADAVRPIARRFFRNQPDTAIKADASPVTEADRLIERRIVELLSARFPDHGILGEEYGVQNPRSDFSWVIDPIDGTRAFLTGRPLFGTLIGLLYRGRPILGVLDQPILEERWIGCAGRRTIFNGRLGGTAGTRACPVLADAELSCTALDMITGPTFPGWSRLSCAVRRTSWGGDCYAYGLLALGQLDIVAEAGLKIWDWAALLPIIEGAGGRMTDWRGLPLSDGSDGRVIAVGDARLLAAAIVLLTEEDTVG